jgi:hypothetical protein
MLNPAPFVIRRDWATGREAEVRSDPLSFRYRNLGLPAICRATMNTDEYLARCHCGALDFHHGGSSEGAPGLRPHYNPDFYASYVRDPDGNKAAAVCRGFTKPQ